MIKTPCFVLNVDKALCNIIGFKTALINRFKNNILGYSVKTNSFPGWLDIVKDNGGYAEVVSYDEYNLVLKCGFDKSHIIYNGPMKDKASFIDALENGAIVNIEKKRELDWLLELDRNKSYKIGIRVNLNISVISPEDCKEEESYSRFGFSYENGELKSAIDHIAGLDHVVLKGLHLHRTSKTRSINTYKNICLYALNIIKEYDLNLSYIDIGGGFYGDMPGKPTYQDYIDAIYNVLSLHYNCDELCLIVEPGNALVASPFSYYTSVIDIKNVGDKRIIVTDGTRNDVDPFFHKKDYFKEFINDLSERDLEKEQVFVGCTCLENDKLFIEKGAPQMQIGDIIKFCFVGAYTMCLSPLFIRFFPRVYIKKHENLILAREEWTENEYLQKIKK